MASSPSCVCIFMRHCWKWFCLLVSMLLFCCPSVCHVLALCLNSRRYWHIFFCIQHPMFLVLKIWLTSSTPSSPVDLIIRDTWWQIAAKWLEIQQWSQRRAYRKPSSLFQMVLLLTPYDLLFPPIWVLKCTPGPTSWRMLPPGEYDRRSQQEIFFCIQHYESSNVAICQKYFGPSDDYTIRYDRRDCAWFLMRQSVTELLVWIIWALAPRLTLFVSGF